MFMIGNHRISILVSCAIVLHVFWAAMVMLDHAALNANAVNVLHRYIQSPGLLIALLVLSSVLATVAIFSTRAWTVFLLMPQQILLMASASGAIDSIWLGQFADGVLRPHAFIAADQIYSVIIALGHTVAIIIHARQLSK